MRRPLRGCERTQFQPPCRRESPIVISGYSFASSITSQAVTLATQKARLAAGRICAGLLVGALAGSACTNTTAPVMDGLVGARTAVMLCLDSGKLTAGADCATDTKVRALVGGGSRGTLGLALPAVPSWADQDAGVPGVSPLRIAGLPIALATDHVNQKAYVATIDGGQRRIVQVGLGKLAANRIVVDQSTELSFVPADVAVIQRDGASWLVVADPAAGALRLVAVSAFGPSPQWTTWQVGGSPGALLSVPSRHQLWVGHLQQGYVSTVDSESGTPVGAGVPIDLACRDGLDGDGDGLVDRLDPGCDGPLDDDERNPELTSACTNGVDDDGDGATDGADPGCVAVPLLGGLSVADGCRDGLDNDGDGKVDFPADPGCADAGDGSEASDATGCSNGLDDDGDGQTDGNDLQCSQGLVREWAVDASAAALPGPPSPTCDNGLDDDGDGVTDLQDSDCARRTDGTEAGPDSAPAVRLAITSDDQWIAVAHQGRREVLFIDAVKRELLRPVVGQSTPYQRTSKLDAHDNVLGLAFGGRPAALTAVTYAGKPAIAIATAPGGLVIAQLDSNRVEGPSIRLLAGPATSATISKPVLWVAGSAVDIGSTIPVRYASLGSLRAETTPDGIRAFGILATKDTFEHRAEQWRLTYQGLLPGGERTTGRWVGPGVLHDAGADFCQIGVVPGDLVILAATPGCVGGSAKAVRVPVLEVFGDTLRLDVSAAVEDLVFTKATQASVDLADGVSLAAAVTLPPPGCYSDGAVPYQLRSAQWLLTGSRTGLLSHRHARDGRCADLSPELVLASRLTEATLRKVAGVVQRPATCPYAGTALDEAFEPTPLNTPVFQGLQMRPGCGNKAVGGSPVVQVLPSLREAAWTWNLTPGFTPRVTQVGAAPTTLLGGAKLSRLLAADAGQGSLVVIEIATGKVVSTLD